MDGVVTNKSHIELYDGKQVTVCGLYQAVPMPSKGAAAEKPAAEYAVIILADGTNVYLGSYNTDEAKRPSRERTHFEGRQVRVTGTVHRLMPTQGQGLIAPSVNEITEITEAIGET